MKKLSLLIFLSFLVLLSPVFVYADTDKTNLQTHRNEVASVINNQTLYEENSYNAFYSGLTALGGITAVDDLLDDVLAEQTTIDQMNQDLITILGYLTLETTHNETYLQYLTEDLRNMSPYTQRSITLYNTEMNRIKDILDEPTSGETAIINLRSDIANVVNLLVLLGDKTTLLSTYQEAEDIYLDGSLYLPQAYALFVSSYDAIDASLNAEIHMTKTQVVNYADASQDEVDLTLTKIEASLALLELKPDKTDFVTLITSIQNNFDSDLYTPNSSVLYLDEIASIYTDGMLDTTTSTELAELTTDVDLASSLLVLRADVSELDRLNNLAIAAYYEEKANYTEDSYNLFKQAVTNYGGYLYINTKISDLNISQAEIDALALEVSNALALLEELQDNQTLLIDYNTLATMDTSGFTPNSVEAFQSFLVRIYENIESKNLNETMYDETMGYLVQALQMLELKADISVLQTLYAQAENYKEEDYSTSSYQYLVLVMNEANDIILNENVFQTTVDDQVQKLTDAIGFLAKPAGVITIHVGEKFDVIQYVTLGDSSVASIGVDDREVLTLGDDLYATGVSYGQTEIVVTLGNGITQTIDVLVKANISVPTVILAVLVPVISVGLAVGLLFYKPSFVQQVKSFLTKKRG